MMEVFAGFLSHTDDQIGRLLDFLETIGALDDTLVLLISDNGTSAEGGPIGSFNEHRFTHDQQSTTSPTRSARIDDLGGFRSYNHYPWGWAWAGNTPLRLWKRYTWLGGVRTPLIAHWPNGIADGGAVRSQFCHAVDLLPTISTPSGSTCPSGSTASSSSPRRREPAAAPSTDAGRARAREHPVLRDARLAGRSTTTGGRRRPTTSARSSPSRRRRSRAATTSTTTTGRCSTSTDDFAESTRRRRRAPRPGRRRSRSCGGRRPGATRCCRSRTASSPGRWRWSRDPNAPAAPHHLPPGGGGIAEDLLPPIGAGFRLTADLEVPAGDAAAAGVLCALGDWMNGWAWYLLDGRPVDRVHPVRRTPPGWPPTEPVGPGDHELGLTYARRRRSRSSSTASRWRRRPAAGRPAVPLADRRRRQLLVGRDAGFPVCDDYEPPFPCTAELRTITFEIPMFAPHDPAEQVATALRSE